MKVLHIIGADLSKKTVDFASHSLQQHLKIENTVGGFKKLLEWITRHNIDVSQVMIVMEHTGLYSYRLEQFLHHQQVRFTKVSALAIKRSMGLVRGKSDKQDAFRIAKYGVERANQLVPLQPTAKSLQRLQLLHSTRQRLVKTRAGIQVIVDEYQQTCGLKKSDSLIAGQLKLINQLSQQIQKINAEMETIIAEEKSLHTNFILLQSIKGVGKVLALAMLIKTGNFTRFTNARKFACYCGTAPFENTSGTSIRGKTRVSHLADKSMKTLLDLAAKSAIQHDKELQQYFLKRTQIGKSKMSTINVVRNKLLYRMFAVIKRQTPFVENYLKAA